MINLAKIGEFLKKRLNSIRIPRLVDFLTNKKGEELYKNAPPAEGNWKRMIMDKISNIGLPVWVIISLPFVVLFFMMGKDALIFLIENISAAFVVLLFGAVLYYIIQSFREGK